LAKKIKENPSICERILLLFCFFLGGVTAMQKKSLKKALGCTSFEGEKRKGRERRR
jgi:hypothetical protein